MFVFLSAWPLPFKTAFIYFTAWGRTLLEAYLHLFVSFAFTGCPSYFWRMKGMPFLINEMDDLQKRYS